MCIISFIIFVGMMCVIACGAVSHSNGWMFFAAVPPSSLDASVPFGVPAQGPRRPDRRFRLRSWKVSGWDKAWLHRRASNKTFNIKGMFTTSRFTFKGHIWSLMSIFFSGQTDPIGSGSLLKVLLLILVHVAQKKMITWESNWHHDDDDEEGTKQTSHSCYNSWNEGILLQSLCSIKTPD